MSFGIRGGAKKPQYNSSIHNYFSHMVQNKKNLKGQLKEAIQDGQAIAFFSIRAKFLDPLIDGHDLTDELVGATLLPVWLLADALVQLIQAAMIGLSFFQNKRSDAGDDSESEYDSDDDTLKATAAVKCVLAGAALTLAFLSFVKSIASLITRPITTVIQGWDTKASHDRFKKIDDHKIVKELVVSPTAPLEKALMSPP